MVHSTLKVSNSRTFQGLSRTYTGSIQAPKLSMESHILHSVRQNLDCNVTNTVLNEKQLTE